MFPKKIHLYVWNAQNQSKIKKQTKKGFLTKISKIWPSFPCFYILSYPLILNVHIQFFFPGLFSFSIDLQFKELADEFQEPMYFY